MCILFWKMQCLLLLFSHYVISLWPQGLQRVRLPCPPLSPGVCSNSHPSSRQDPWVFSLSLSEFCSIPNSGVSMLLFFLFFFSPKILFSRLPELLLWPSGVLAQLIRSCFLVCLFGFRDLVASVLIIWLELSLSTFPLACQQTSFSTYKIIGIISWTFLSLRQRF